MNQIQRKLDQIKRELDLEKLAKEGAQYLKSITPIDRGNARKNTYAQGTDIVADYEYAGRLDENHSKQTNGKGLIQPTIDFLNEKINKLG